MNFLKSFSNHAHWLVRIALASIFLYHGLGKFPQAPMMAKMMNMPVFMIYLLGMMETLAALLLIVGGLGKDWATRIGGILIATVMAGAIMMVHWGQWSFQATESHPMGGMEFQVMILLISLFLVIRGNEVGPSQIEIS